MLGRKIFRPYENTQIFRLIMMTTECPVGAGLCACPISVYVRGGHGGPKKGGHAGPPLRVVDVMS